MKLLLISVLLVFLAHECANAHRQRYHGPSELNADQYPIFCDQWKKISFGPKFPALNVRCFTEAPYNITGKELILDARSASRDVGCAIRLPRHVSIKVITVQYDDINAKAARVYSGLNCRHVSSTHVNLLQTNVTYGPFNDDYNVLHYRPSNYYDKFVFMLIRAEEEDK